VIYLIIMKVSVILLTWKRIKNLVSTLESLSNQTYKDFDVYVSNGNLDRQETLERYCKLFKDRLSIQISHDGNEHYSFRRIFVARKLALTGTEVILFIDDDVEIPNNYIKNCLSQYEPNTYKSGYAWHFTSNVRYYKQRFRVTNEEHPVHYAGTAVSMIDAKIFLEDGLLEAPPCAYRIEDLWMSYYASHVLGWKLSYIKDHKAKIFGRDSVALAQQVKDSGCNKDELFFDLVTNYGWKLST
jgi:glycosyltransferase involved in cell wall biosynthesis